MSEDWRNLQSDRATGKRRCLSRSRGSSWPLRITFQAGTIVPIHASASGKLFLALMPGSKRDQLLDEIELTSFTDSTIVGRSKLKSELRQIRKQAYALDREEYVPGLICIAVPIFRSTGRDRVCIAALTIQAPKVRLSVADAVAKLADLQEAALAIAGTFD